MIPMQNFPYDTDRKLIIKESVPRPSKFLVVKPTLRAVQRAQDFNGDSDKPHKSMRVEFDITGSTYKFGMDLGWQHISKSKDYPNNWPKGLKHGLMDNRARVHSADYFGLINLKTRGAETNTYIRSWNVTAQIVRMLNSDQPLFPVAHAVIELTLHTESTMSAAVNGVMDRGPSLVPRDQVRAANVKYLHIDVIKKNATGGVCLREGIQPKSKLIWKR